MFASTVHDLIRFGQALAHGRLLPVELVREMLTGVDVGAESHPFTHPAYGLGVMLDRQGKGTGIVGHGGGGPGYGAALFRRYGGSTQASTVAVLSNGGGGAHVERAALALLAAVEHQSS